MQKLTHVARGSLLAVLASGVMVAHAQTGSTQEQPAERAQPAPDLKTRIETVFRQTDADGDGKLSSEEVQQHEALAARFQALDKNKDGFLSSEEFSSGVIVREK